MTFKQMEEKKYPPRLWALVGEPGSGKSTFSTQMKTPLLPIDADHRYTEVTRLVAGNVYQLSDDPADNTNPSTIARLLDDNMIGSGVKTIIVDSLTAIITPLVAKAMQDNLDGINTNKMSSFIPKAIAMRQIQDAVSKWGVDVLWIYHLQKGRDEKAAKVVRATLSKTERARLYRSLNLELHVVEQNGKRGIKVVWARRGRSGMTLWDETGFWAGMPEKIEAAVYGGLTEDEQKKLETQPTSFPNPEAAINWGFEQQVFETIQHARNAYEKLKRESNPNKAVEMWALWIEDVNRRLIDFEQQEDELSPVKSGLEEEPNF